MTVCSDLLSDGGVRGGVSRDPHGLVCVLQVDPRPAICPGGRRVSHHFLAGLPQAGLRTGHVV